VGRGALVFGNGAAALKELEGTAGGLGPYDGLTGPLDRQWAVLAERGLAPTPLEQYARCPFQYFSAQILKLEPVRERPGAELPARALGELCHAILSRCYRQWRDEGWPQTALTGGKAQADVESITEEVFAAYAKEHGAGYPLLWRIAKDVMASLVTAAAAADEQEFHASGFRPESFEVEADGSLEPAGGPELKGIRVRGRLDRVDRRETPPGLRVVDYKYRHGSTMKDEDKNLVVSAVRGYRLQPPLYAMMTPKGMPGGAGAVPTESVEFVFLAPRWEAPVERASFDPSVWTDTAGRAIAQTLRLLIEGIRGGQYFVLPDGYCDHCEFAAACRRFHGPTWWRAHISPQAKRLRHLRKQKAGKP
jgi:ATP-dependent helicase/nuclease subunit B